MSFAEPILIALGLRDFFDLVAGPSLSAHTEDKAATIGAAVAGLEPDRAVMVGDRSLDIVVAHARGLPAIGVTWGIGGSDELRSARADTLIEAPVELPAAIGVLWQRRTSRSDAQLRAGRPPAGRAKYIRST